MAMCPVRAASEVDLTRIAQFNCTKTQFPDHLTLSELIEPQIAAHASETAVICDHDQAFSEPSLTWAQLNERVNQLANTLRAEGVGPGQIVAIMVERSFAMAIGTLAIVKSGAAYLPVSPENPPDRIEYLLRDAGVKILLSHSPTAGRT